MNDDCNRSDPETTRTSQDSPTHSRRIVNAVPTSGQRQQTESEGSLESDSLSPVALGENGPSMTDSDNSTEGYSLVDDAGDSVAGSLVHSEATQANSLSTPSHASLGLGPSRDSKASLNILLPQSYRFVQQARRCFWVFWVVGTITVTTSLWAMARNELENQAADVDAILDEEHFISKLFFDAQTDVLQQVWKSRLESKLQVMDVLSVSMTSNAASEEVNWPFVAFPDFERRVASLREFTFWMPLIGTSPDGSELSIWANYSQGYLDNELYNDNESLSFNQRYLPESNSGTMEDIDYFLPVWQHAQPRVPSLFNYDLSSHPQLASTTQAVIMNGQPALSRSFLRQNVPEDDIFLLSVLPEDGPAMFLFYPMLENFNATSEQSKVGGIVATLISWNELLAAKHIDMPHFKVTVQTSSCSDNDTYDLVVALGDSNSVTRLDADSSQTSNQRRRSVDLTSDIEDFGEPRLVGEASGGCSYVLNVEQEEAIEFGTNDFQSESRIPVNILIGVMVFAIVLALAFLFFDWSVRRRENDLAAEATRTRNIVSSLFPSQFHDRLFQTNDNDNGLNNALRQSDDFEKVFRGVEAAVSSHFELPLDADETSSCMGNSDCNKDGVNEKGQEGKTEGLVSKTIQELSDGHTKNEDVNASFENLTPSTHSKGAGFRELLSKSSSMPRRSGGNGVEPSFMNRPEQESRPGFGRDFLARATSVRNMLQFNGSDSFLGGRSEHGTGATGDITKDEPIADLFPEATVMFADISGFTAWSSTREPSQVFKLLETIYRSFDRMARKRKVFKVETIGDCYMAVTGVPDPQPDHAVIMALFAKECLIKMREVTRTLEATLGPETGDLCMRFGLHSGPVTAGVLRGEKSRFQLFGDTVNFASRMESTGRPKRIQASRATAELLIDAGKENWVQLRDDMVYAKGKGLVQSYWVFPRSNSMSTASMRSLGDSIGSIKGQNLEKNNSLDGSVHLKTRTKKSMAIEGTTPSFHSTNTSETLHASRRSMLSSSHHSQVWAKEHHIDDPIEEGYDGFADDGRQERLIEWNVKILAGFLKRILASRQAGGAGGGGVDEVPQHSRPRRGRRVVEPELVFETKAGESAFDEITEIIPLATTRRYADQSDNSSTDTIDLPVKVEIQLKKYVTNIAFMYRDNFFHNFEHASHVLMSAQKLLQRVIGADKNGEWEARQNEHAWIIASDPLTQFAIVFAALIHDVDHTGVPNSQLVKEKAHVASLYKNRSVAEQNSLELAWEMLMSREYRDLQRAIFANQEELQRFRQLIVNVVLATDIFDPEMIQIRNSRWEKAFGENASDSELSDQVIQSLKATIVIEYIMQASDVSHSMQHWHVYQKWNERLFEEMYSAFQVGRGDQDPSLGWYKGELWFFDNYVIPLAKKLKESEVFGAASSQFLKFAMDNREEWEKKGEDIVAGFVDKHSQQL